MRTKKQPSEATIMVKRIDFIVFMGFGLASATAVVFLSYVLLISNA